MYINRYGRLRPGEGGSRLLLDRAAAVLSGGLEKLVSRRFEPQALWDHSPQGYVGHLHKNLTARVDLQAARVQMLRDYLGSSLPLQAAKAQLVLAPFRAATQSALLAAARAAR